MLCPAYLEKVPTEMLRRVQDGFEEEVLGWHEAEVCKTVKVTNNKKTPVMQGLWSMQLHCKKADYIVELSSACMLPSKKRKGLLEMLI